MGGSKRQWKWRTQQPPPGSNEPDYYLQLTYAVVDALVHEGICAWNGDAVGCVTQIIDAQVKAREKAEAEVERLRSINEQLRLLI